MQRNFNVFQGTSSGPQDQGLLMQSFAYHWRHRE
jgi:hypothetical protein